jgi:opacity protein-like surface antigen
MKNTIAILLLVLSALVAFSQENMLTLSGGYTFANIEEADADGTGWRINGLFEFAPMNGKVAHGFSFGYISLSAEDNESQDVVKYDVGVWPVYYAPKYLFGNEKMKGFIKAAVGWQFSNIDRTGAVSEIETTDSGFTLGAGAGAMYLFNEKVFLSAEYEFLWLQNSYFRDGYLNTASLGLGLRF